MSDEKKEEKAFTVMVDSDLRKKARLVALNHGVTMKAMIERLLQLVIDVDGIENLERICRENRDE